MEFHAILEISGSGLITDANKTESEIINEESVKYFV